ncbi:hypothetical protein N7539_006060 [Penicillium diatomitis]|uniref:Uncharacterized protein n=1 Tax=Penicillium diatomitis TaxID=2819901 RepID=A0A9W9X583_9EURO|nr:uncharacterized protein N7539_006060 [Penicillium diatomitis]KAJ5483860.1 hypothetical protein N7539_006060 [Penicillium diatomitis]
MQIKMDNAKDQSCSNVESASHTFHPCEGRQVEQRSAHRQTSRATRSSARPFFEPSIEAVAGSSVTATSHAESASKNAQGSPLRSSNRKSNQRYEPYGKISPLRGSSMASRQLPSINDSPSQRIRLVPDEIVEYHGTEARPRPWRNTPPEAYLDKIDRIDRSRMFIVGQQVHETKNRLEFHFQVVGSTGNIYTVKIGKLPSCDCPDAKFRGRGECKHIVYGTSRQSSSLYKYSHPITVPKLSPQHPNILTLLISLVLLKALNARPELRYQLSFVPSELREMYEGSLMSAFEAKGILDQDHEGHRKPLDGACPICFTDFTPKDKTVWCQTGCGNNVHKVCFEQWARASRSSQGPVRCIYCRIEWPSPGSDPKVEKLRQSGTLGPGGYINVAEQFGLSPKRGTSCSLLFEILLFFNFPTIALLWAA